MKTWVAVLLIILAFVAGGLSSRISSNSESQEVALPASPSPVIAATPTPPALAEASPSPATTRPAGRPKDPKFGTPPGAASLQPRPKTSPRVEGEIKAMVFSAEVGDDRLAQTRFPASCEAIYLTATPHAVPDKVELTASFRSALVEEAPFSDPVPSSGPPRRRTFRLARPKEGWTPGPYQLAIRPAGSEQVLALSRFEILGEGAPLPTPLPEPSYLELKKQAQDQGSVSLFSTADRAIYLQVDSATVPSGLPIRTVWSAVEARNLERGELVAVAETLAPGPEEDALFTLAPPDLKSQFLPGSYRVDVYFDQQRVGTQAFFIQPAETTATASPAL